MDGMMPGNAVPIRMGNTEQVGEVRSTWAAWAQGSAPRGSQMDTAQGVLRVGRGDPSLEASWGHLCPPGAHGAFSLPGC